MPRIQTLHLKTSAKMPKVIVNMFLKEIQEIRKKGSSRSSVCFLCWITNYIPLFLHLSWVISQHPTKEKINTSNDSLFQNHIEMLLQEKQPASLLSNEVRHLVGLFFIVI